MPPVRWKAINVAVTAICLLYSDLIIPTIAQQMQEPISMTSDGWRPIIGTRHEPIYHDHLRNNESPRSDIQIVPPTTQPPTFQPTITPSPTQSSPIPHLPRKPFIDVKNHGSHGVHTFGPGSHPRHTPTKKYTTSSKPYLQMSMNGKRYSKPVRTSQPSRDEVFTASASSGLYSAFNNVKTREVGGLGGPPLSHYSINQPHSHIEFTNRFAPPSNNDGIFPTYNNPIQGFIFPKHPQINDVNYQFQSQNDEYTRNLVPPPLLYKNKENTKAKGTKEVSTDKIVFAKPNQEKVVQVPAPPQYQFQPSQKLQSDPSKVQVQLTKEKLNVFHNNIPSSYNGDYIDYDFHSVRRPTDVSKLQTYEVTEGKWQEPSAQYVPYHQRQSPNRYSQIELNVPPFLPTPFRPEGQAIVPTSPTQSEVSTIFTKLSQHRQKEREPTENPFSFDIKEVSTHYPILGKPTFEYAIPTQEIPNEITSTPESEEEEVMTTTARPRPSHHRRRRPTRLRTTTSTTTEEPMEVSEEYVTEFVEEAMPRPRKPSRVRTTLSPMVDSEEVQMKPTRVRGRYKHRPTQQFVEYEQPKKRVRVTTQATEYYQPPVEIVRESEEMEDESSSTEMADLKKTQIYELELPGRHYSHEPEKKTRLENPVEDTTTERILTTHIFTPDNDIEVSVEPSTESEEVETTNAPTTTTTATSTTIKPSQRVRGRPIKYDTSHRPRFSVKDYRQKLTQYSTTEAPRSTTEARPRISSRLRRPIISTQATITDEDSTEPSRSRFTPKEPRHSATTEDAIITEKNVKAVNTRLRPFGRYRSTTVEPSTTPKVAIKTNLFSSRRRPPVLTLRSKIYNRYNKNATEEEKVKEDVVSTQEPITEDVLTEKIDEGVADIEETKEDDTSTIASVSKNESYNYSQRVSDLTSSAKNDYNTPGMFKSLSPISRKIPNYFTIATDDPILPIEAFFPNLKEKTKD